MADRRTFLGLAAAALLPIGLDAQAPAARPAASSKTLVEASLGNALDPKVTLTSLPVPRGFSVAAHTHEGPVFAYILQGDIETEPATLLTFTVGATGKAGENAK